MKFQLYRSPKSKSQWEFVVEGHASLASWEDELGQYRFQTLGIPREGVRIRVGKPKTNNWIDVEQFETNPIVSIEKDNDTGSQREIIFKTEKLKYKWILTK